MSSLHRRILAVIIGAAAVLGVAALSLTASLGPGGGSANAEPAALVTTTKATLSPAQARAELAKARAELKKAIAERRAVENTPRRTVTVVQQAPASAISATRSGGEHEYDDDHAHEGGEDD